MNSLVRWGGLASVPLLAVPAWMPAAWLPLVFVVVTLVIVVATRHLTDVAGWGLVLLSGAVVIASARAPLAGSLPHMGGYALGLVIALLTVEYGRSRSLAVFLLAGLAAVTAGLLFVRVDTFKFLPLSVTDALPKLGQFVPFLGAEGRVNPNALSGLCLLVLPMAWAARRPAVSSTRLVQMMAWILSGLSVAALILAQSRAAWVAMGCTVVLRLCWRAIRRPQWRVPAVVTVAALAGLAGTLWWLDPREVERVLVSGWSSIDRRWHVWEAGWAMAVAHPWGGVGLDQFRALYVPPPGSAPGFDVAHAHNFPLQLVLDVGLMGTVGYLVLLVRTIRVPATCELRPAIVTALVAVHLFGLFDALALGTKIGVFQWWIMAIAWSHVFQSRQGIR